MVDMALPELNKTDYIYKPKWDKAYCLIPFILWRVFSMYYENNTNNRSLYHINFYSNNKGYESCIIENLLQYVYHTANRARSIPLYRKATKYFKIKNMRVSYNNHYNYYNLRRVTNAIGTSNVSLYSLAIKNNMAQTNLRFHVVPISKRTSFSDIVHRYDHRIKQTEDFNIYETTFNL